MTFAVRNPGCIATTGLASFPFARRYSDNRCFFLFLRLLRCFSSAGFPPYNYAFIARWPHINTAGFPHSDIRGSMDICSSPRLLAACHVLLRLLMPRHSPCALSCLTYLYTFQYTSYPFSFTSSFLFRSALFSFQCAMMNTSVFIECLEQTFKTIQRKRPSRYRP